MNTDSLAIRCSIIRGGTSKGVYIMENELPKDPALREKVILALFGSPDVRQIDGLGGADLLTSKLAIIGPSSVEGADIDYTFGQVSMTEPHVEFNSNCGNISSGVGVFAINNGLVRPAEPITTVGIHITNLNKIITAEIPVKEGKAMVDGDFSIDGVPGKGAKIALDWSNVTGGTTGKLLPTGNPIDTVNHEGREYHISIVDAGTISVFVPAEELGLTGTETPQEMDGNEKTVRLLEAIRGKACEKIGLVSDWEVAKKQTYYLPFIVTVAPPRDYTCFTGTEVKKEQIDLVGRLSTMGLINKTFAGSGTVCTGAAARIPGSVVYNLLSEAAKNRETLNIGHSAGIIPVESEAETERGVTKLNKVKIYRTARVIMDGTAYIRRSSLEEIR